MTPPAVVIFLTLLIGLATDSVEALGSPSSIAIIPLAGDGAATVCTIVYKNTTRSIECSIISHSVNVSTPFPMYPAVSFASIAGGGLSLCGLELEGTTLYCWSHVDSYSNGTPTRVYNDTVPLRDLVRGESHVAAADKNGTFIRWWCDRRQDFPEELSGNFSSITSGTDFVCAIDTNDAVDCWGPGGARIKEAFAGQRMSTVVAGDSRACGVTKNGRFLCSWKGFGRPSFEFQSLALGSNDTCALRSNETAVCWRADGEEYTPTNEQFMFLVAGGGLFCGLTREEYSIHCWWSGRPSRIVELPLQSVAPGICASRSSCHGNVVSGSVSYCSNDEVVCKPFTYSPYSPHSPRRSRWPSERIQWLVIGFVFFFGSVLGIWAQWSMCKEVLSSCLPSRFTIQS